MARTNTIAEAADPVGEAIGLVQVLEQKLGDGVAHREELGAEREQIAFLAVGEGNAAALRRVDEINAEIAIGGETVSTIEAALTEARRRLAAARHHATLAAAAGQAVQAGEHVLALLAEAQELDRLARELVERAKAFDQGMRDLRALSAPVPAHLALGALLLRCLESATMSSPFQSHFLSPGERMTFAGLAASTAGAVRRWAKLRGVELGEHAEKAA